MPVTGQQPGAPISKLEFFSGAFGSKPAEALTFEAQMDALWQVERMELSSDHPIDFVEALKRIQVAAPDGLTQREAASEFLKWADRVAPLLSSLHTALEAGNWDFGLIPELDDEEGTERRLRIFRLFHLSGKLLAVAVQAHWQLGHPDEALSEWRSLARLCHQEDGSAFLDSGAFHGEYLDPDMCFVAHLSRAGNCLRSTALIGLSSGAWRDSDLPILAGELSSFDPLDSFRQCIRAEREAIAAVYARATREPAFLHLWQKRQLPSREGIPSDRVLGPLEDLSISLITQSEISTNAAMADRFFERQEALFNYRDRLCLPRPPGASPFDADILHRVALVWYFRLLPFSLSTYGREQAPARQQYAIDQTRIALALESHRRSTGSYPDQLNAIAPSFPGGIPHDVATGQPFFYEKSPDSTYRLWGTGIDGINNGGLALKDVVFSLPKPK